MPAPVHDFNSPESALTALCATFSDVAAITDNTEVVAPADVPPPFDALLVHHDHMTTRLGAFHGAPVTLDVLHDALDGETYRRHIVLKPQGSDRIVEVGIVRIHLGCAALQVREAILGRQTPLGDILIAHDVLRRIEPKWYLRFEPGHRLLESFRPAPAQAVYGRIGVIHYEGRPAIELLEIVRGEKA